MNNHFGGRQGASHSNLLENSVNQTGHCVEAEMSSEKCQSKRPKVSPVDRLSVVSSIGINIKEGLSDLGSKMVQPMAEPA